MINVWIGFDEQFAPNRQVQLDSIIAHTTDSVTVNYISTELLARPLTDTQSTMSAFSRWLVPRLAGYEGWHLYMDSDMLVRQDLADLWELRDDSKSVMVVKHPQYVMPASKFNGKLQTVYDRKNWSSLILFNASRCENLTVDYVNTASGLDLHQFKWLDDTSIGALPNTWNHLVGCEPPNPNASIVHWTLGGPWFPEYANTEFSNEWNTLYSTVSSK